MVTRSDIAKTPAIGTEPSIKLDETGKVLLFRIDEIVACPLWIRRSC